MVPSQNLIPKEYIGLLLYVVGVFLGSSSKAGMRLMGWDVEL